MNEDPKKWEDEAENCEAPMVFRVAQLPVSSDSTMDRRTFVKGTIAAVGAGALITVMGGSGCSDGGTSTPDCSDNCVCNKVCTCEQVGACLCDADACQCQVGCECHTVCPSVTMTCKPLPGTTGNVKPGETGINVNSPTGETRTMPCGSPIPPGWTCTCNCVTVPAPASGPKPTGGGSHYWYPC
jgi:hypothetical protein